MPKKSTSQISRRKPVGKRREPLTEAEIRKLVIRASRSSLASQLAEATGLKEESAERFLDSLTSLAYRETKKIGEFVIPGIGKLIKVPPNSRKGSGIEFRIAEAARDSVLGGKRPIKARKGAAKESSNAVVKLRTNRIAKGAAHGKETLAKT